MKMRMIKMRPEFLIEKLQGKASFTSNLPDNIELLDIKYDFFSKQVSAIIRSDDFEDVVESYPPPEFNVIYRTNLKAEFQPTTNVKTEFKPPEKTPVQPSRDTSAIEKEFSPEQRNLLSFTVDGEYVTIKPNQYLKDEWDEINDTVRSLGGKWMKGNNSSYWAIRRT
ncbi:MAG: hypothetical protein ABR962_03130 [Candidatus Bathyarchaeia archaeon]|jgi:hypothetical protein